MYYVEISTKGVKNKQYVKGVRNDYPLFGSWQEAAPFSKACAQKIKSELEKELTCGKAVVAIIEKS
ncbi:MULTISPECIES: hypothetical protein [unclassified Enterococcus]|uniref:hypothetical protein n=1 Tax=unclassified Enterococcus TaxID=2608891 RepID=UPI0013EC9917|nr:MULTISPECIES: hypothetical protein [unclassified Enterococcus]